MPQRVRRGLPKIAMVGDFPLDPSRIDGGVQAATKYLVDGLLKTDAVELHVLTFNSTAKRPVKHKLGTLTLHVLPRQRLGAFSRWHIDFKTLKTSLSEIQPHIIHGQGGGVEGFLSVKCGLPSIITFHGIMAVDAKFKSRRLDRWRLALQSRITERTCAVKCDHAILISSYVEQVFGGLLTAKRHYIPNAIGDQFFLTNRVEQPGRVLFAGRVIPIKGVIELVRAIAEVNRHTSCELYLAGSLSSDEHYVREVRKEVEQLGIAARVHFLGLVNEERLIQEFSRAAVLVLPSFQENAPMVIEQAMAAGVPIVASRIGGIPSMIQHGQAGFLTAPGDVIGLAESVGQLLCDESLRRQFGQRAAYQARSYSARIVAEQTLEVYRQVKRGWGY